MHGNIDLPCLYLDTSRDHLKIGDFHTAWKTEGETALRASRPFDSPQIRKAILSREWDITNIAHNPVKSEVYSLGMLFLCLSAMQEPIFPLPDLSNALRSWVSGRSFEGYSQEWKNLLLWMTEVDEKMRPDFVALNERINTGEKEWELDDRIPLSYVKSNERLSVEVTCGQTAIRIGGNRKAEGPVPCLISLTANSLPRPNPIDVVCAVDLSGSMEGDWLVLIQHVLVDLIERMGAQDRLSIVGFSEEVRTVCRLTACTEAGKQTLYQCISSLQTDGCTNLPLGFQTALSILSKRRVKNTATSIVLISDGSDNSGSSVYEACCAAFGQNKINEIIHCHCFGLGTTINASLLEQLAASNSGEFRCISELADIKAAVKVLFPLLSKATVRHIRVVLNPHDSQIPIQIIGLNYENEVRFPDLKLHTGTDHFLLFHMVFKPTGPLSYPLFICPFIVSVSYVVKGLPAMSMEIPLQVNFVQWSDAPPAKVRNVHVRCHCAKGKNVIEEARRLCKTGNSPKARKILDELIDGIGSLLSTDPDMSQERMSVPLEEVLLADTAINKNQKIYANLHPLLLALVKQLVLAKNSITQ